MASKITFFESYYDAAQLMEPDERADFYNSMFAFVFEGIEPEPKGRVQQIAWLLVKPNLESSLQKQAYGSKGGRPKSEDSEKEKPAGKAAGKPNGKPSGKPTQKPTGKPNGKTYAKTDKDKERDRDKEKEGEFFLPSEEEKTPPVATDGAAMAGATPPSAPESDSSVPVCPLCSKPARLRTLPGGGVQWSCDMCGDIKEPRFEAVG